MTCSRVCSQPKVCCEGDVTATKNRILEWQIFTESAGLFSVFGGKKRGSNRDELFHQRNFNGAFLIPFDKKISAERFSSEMLIFKLVSQVLWGLT